MTVEHYYDDVEYLDPPPQHPPWRLVVENPLYLYWCNRQIPYSCKRIPLGDADSHFISIHYGGMWMLASI